MSFKNDHNTIPSKPTGYTTILHPKTQLPTRRPRSDPVQCWMEFRNGGHSSDTVTTQLCQLLALRGVDIDETVHISDAEALDVVLWVLLPLGAESVVYRQH